MGALLAWSHTTGGGIEVAPSVSVGGVFVGSDDGNLYTFDATTGGLLATTTLSTNAVRTTPTYADGVLFVGVGIQTSLLTAAGAVIGHIPAATEFGGITVADGAVYIQDFNDQELVRYDLGVGSLAVPRPAVGSLHPDTTLHAH